jgi:peptidyl-prolyl cis-trans isomerase C
MTATSRFGLLAGVGAAVVVAVAGLATVTAVQTTQAQSTPAPAAAPAPAAPAAPQAPAAATAAPANPGAAQAAIVVATIDGEPITELDLEIAYQEFDAQLARFGPEQRRQVTIDLLTHIRLLAKEAQRLAMPTEPAMASKLRIVHDRALYSEYLDRLFAREVTESAARKLYADKQATAGKQYEYKVRHILVPTLADAQSVIAKLDNGGDFAQIAKDVSIDPGSAGEGGDLGFIAAGDTVKEFETAAFALDVGSYSKSPVESQFGFHVIKVDERRDAAPRTFEDSIPDLQDELAQKAFQTVLDGLKAKATIVRPPAGPPR